MMDGKNLSNLIWIPIIIVLFFYLAGGLLWLLNVLIVSWWLVWLWPLAIIEVWIIIEALNNIFREK
jgi:hypothetical protein